jgi:hypothetical protein
VDSVGNQARPEDGVDMSIGIGTQEKRSPEQQPPELKRSLRLYAGLSAFALSIILPVFVIIIPYMRTREFAF